MTEKKNALSLPLTPLLCEISGIVSTWFLFIQFWSSFCFPEKYHSETLEIKNYGKDEGKKKKGKDLPRFIPHPNLSMLTRTSYPWTWVDALVHPLYPISPWTVFQNLPTRLPISASHDRLFCDVDIYSRAIGPILSSCFISASKELLQDFVACTYYLD